MGNPRKDFKLSSEKIEAINNFLEFKKTAVISKSKLDNYRYFISSFLNHSKKSLKDYTEKELIDFINDSSKHYSTGSLNSIKISLMSFICFHFEDFPSRFKNLKRICKSQKTEKPYSPEQMLTKEDIEKLVQEEPELRWKAFFLLYFYGGFRPKEVCELKWDNITFQEEGCFVRIVSKKNLKEFQKFIPEDVCFYLKKLKERSFESEYIFPTKRKYWNTTKKDQERIFVGDKPQTRSGVYQHLLPLAKRVLNKHVNPYILRHSIATILYNRDDLKDDDVAQQLGHTKAMRQTYNNLSIDKIRDRMKKIYIKSELKPEQKKEYEQRIKELETKVNELEQVKKLTINNQQLMKEVIEKLKSVKR